MENAAIHGVKWKGRERMTESTPGERAVRGEQSAHPKRTRGPGHSLSPIVAKDSKTGHIRADSFQQTLVHVLRSREGYEYYPGMNIAEVIKTVGKKQDGQLISTIHPRENEDEHSVFQALTALGDGCMDTYAALQMMALDQNGTDNITRPFLAGPDDILALCDKQKSNYSYTAESRLERIAHLKALSQISIIATMPGHRKNTVYRAEGRLLSLVGKVGEYVASTGETIWEKYSIALGPFITMVPELNQQTAIVLRQLLAYSGKNQKYQKRLGYYLTFMFKNNARRGCTFTCSMGALLAGADITPDRKRIGEFKDAIEHALAILKRDGIIGSYACIVEASPEVEQHATGWWEKYQQMKWKFEAPGLVKAQYRKLLKEGNIP